MNKFERFDYPIKNLSNGDTLNLTMFRITGETEGPHVHIQSGVHGAEIQGHGVIYRLMEYFKEAPLKGSITFIPMANPMALIQKSGTHTLGRFNAVTGDNWNRNYVDFASLDKEQSGFSYEEFCQEHLETEWPTIVNNFKKALIEANSHYEKFISKRGLTDNKKLNLLLQKVASTADIVLDLHTGPNATRYLYAAEFEREAAKSFSFPHTLIIPNKFAGAMDEATFCPWLRLQEEFKKRERIVPMHFESFTVELGSEEKLSLSDAHVDRDRILSYLKGKNIAPDFKQVESGKQYVCLLKDYKSYYSPCGGVIDYIKGPGELVKKDEVLGEILNFKGINGLEDLDKALTSIKAIDDCLVINHTPSSSVSEGMILYQVMENVELF